ncbi:MAG: hypothetical protein ABW148_17555 [Sedimenticola sp.]
MTFVNERIPDDDYAKYHLHEIEERVLTGGVRSSIWTIDRTQNMFLRQVYEGREELVNEVKWAFLWEENIILVEAHYSKTKYLSDGSKRYHVTVVSIRLIDYLAPRLHADKSLPDDLKLRRDEILTDFKEAMLVHHECETQSNPSNNHMIVDLHLRKEGVL